MLLAPFLWIFCEFDEKVLDNSFRVARNGSHSIRQKESAKIKTIYLMSHGETLFNNMVTS